MTGIPAHKENLMFGFSPLRRKLLPVSSQPSRQRGRLRLECLETREVPSTISVTSLADSGTGSLRDAIAQANASTGVPDTIEFQKSGVITLRSAIQITDDLAINTLARTGITIQGNKTFRLFTADDGTAGSSLNVSFHKLSLKKGKADNGGAIFSNGENLTVTDSILSGNVATNNGGAIACTGGTLNLTNSMLSSNQAGHTETGLFGDPVFLGSGGAVALDTLAPATVSSCRFSGNTGFQAGGGLFGQDGDVTVQGCTFSSNKVKGEFGGAGLAQNAGTLHLLNSIFLGNSTPGSGGGANVGADTATITNVAFLSNRAALGVLKTQTYCE